MTGTLGILESNQILFLKINNARDLATGIEALPIE